MFVHPLAEVTLNTPSQLSLPLSLPDDETFNSFYAGENASLLSAIQAAVNQPHGSYLYFWSRDGGGKSHLLHAACAEVSSKDRAVGYVPLDKRAWFVPDVLEGMEHLSLVCIDNVQCIAGDEEWEMALFNLYNRILETGKTCLLITGTDHRVRSAAVTGSRFRLDWGQIYKLHPLSDDEKFRHCNCGQSCAGLSCRKMSGALS